MRILNELTYEATVKGISLFGDNRVTIIGEQTVEIDTDTIVEQYVYTIDGFVAKNNKPFAARKDNIILL